MPQINRIRVNNVKYNFGTQYYDDFMMRFNCSNTLYDLANGGGKSLLMLLLMQNVIPNCTLDDKQPIEKLFRQGSGNTVIHSLVEWKLDSCYQKDNFKYMTTGFCARKAGNSIDGDSDAGQSSSVEYFNYCIFYREFGENDIKNLPLESNGERITYNGLKAYLRELEKNDFGVSVKIFDAKGEYLNFLTQYGIFESQWEIIRGINKTEGHVRTYFENNYRTSRKVVEDLLIEEIIQKSYNNTLGVDNDEGTMAQTLMDIKDKLLELSKKHSQISSYDSQINAIDGFAEYVKSFEALFDEKDVLEEKLYRLMIACRRALADSEEEKKNLEDRILELTEDKQRELKYAVLGEIAAQEASLEDMSQLIDAVLQDVTNADEQIKERRQKLTDLESARDYKEYVSYSISEKQITEAINNRHLGNEEIISQLQEISAIMKEITDRRSTQLKNEYENASRDLQRYRSMMEDADRKYMESLKEQSASKARMEYIRTEAERLGRELIKAMEAAGLLVSENVGEQIEEIRHRQAEIKSDISKLKLNESDIEKRAAGCDNRVSVLTINNEQLNEQLGEIAGKIQKLEADKSRIEKLLKIYGASSNDELCDILYGIYEKTGRQTAELEQETEELSAFIENAEKGVYKCRSKLHDRLRKYLADTYGEDVIEADEWLRQLEPEKRADVTERVPFIEYGFIIKNDFERIREDATIADFSREAYLIPIVSEQILTDTKKGVNAELIAFAMKDMRYLTDDAALRVESETAKEELDNKREQLERLYDTRRVVWDDYLYVSQLKMYEESSIAFSQKELERRVSDNINEISRLKLTSAEIAKEKDMILQKMSDMQEQLAKTENDERILEDIIHISSDIDRRNAELEELKKKYAEADSILQSSLADREKAKANHKEAGIKCESLKIELESLKNNWDELYRQYYIEETEEKTAENTAKEKNSEDVTELEGRFLGLKELIDRENSDIGDKEALLKHYRNSMEKCVKAIEYRNSSFDDIKKRVGEGTLECPTDAVLYDIKDSIERELEGVLSKRNELDSLNAMKNRLEGSIEHGISKIKENYGEYEKVECDNPDIFITKHKNQAQSIDADIKNLKKQSEALAKEQKDIYVWNKDLERIVGSAGLVIPTDEEIENISPDDEAYIDISGYESVAKEYDRHIRGMVKKRDEFEKRKTLLVNQINSQGAVQLADEIKNSLVMPSDNKETENMSQRLKDITGLIQLEKERVSRGIADMERIKENFENRCIQTCCNIKTDLDRLPKLSTIKMDDETISIVGLSIPYVPEESFKERMSSYIDETIDIAESFATQEERLRYIRNRLTWKRLFSVIVSDMNSIKVNLYKRERIKDQSRYLRYEEAVGSTGQSQGIYIQFLIAIINYISSINAAAGATGVIGKTIFIDNPFGAAKDIYIWEPIFALLKANHVQLIVPARGATPAITGRFDVNYILGQKLTDQRQTTVVVDYYSKTDVAQMEYTRMDYEQTSLFFE